MNPDEFRKRPGTTDQGKDYENLLAAYYSLKLALNDEVEEFKISSNDDKSGNFDDLVIEINWQNGQNEQLNIQAKHKQVNKNNTLLLNALSATRGKFSLRKLLEEFVKNHHQNEQKLILFTNRKMEKQDNTRVMEEEYFSISMVHYQDQMNIVNTTSKGINVYKFEINVSIGANLEKNKKQEINQYKEFFKNFFLFTNQKNVNGIKDAITKCFQNFSIGDETVVKNYIDFVNNWSNRDGKKNKLHKEFIKLKLAEVLLSPHIVTLSEATSNEKSHLFKNAVDEFDITMIENSNIAKNIYRIDSLREEEFEELNHLGIKYGIIPRHVKNISQLNSIQRAFLLWLLDKSPLVLRVMESNEDLIFKTISLCRFNNRKKKFILLGTKRHLDQYKVFQNLADLFVHKNLYNKVITTFSCTFQERKEITLQELISEDEKMRGIITTDQLVLAIDDTFHFGGPKEALPEYYIDRLLTSITIDVEFLDKFSETNSIVISCNGRFNIVKKWIQNVNFLVIDDVSDDSTSPNDNPTNFFNKNNIYIAINKCSNELFEQISEKLQSQTCHHFQVDDYNNLEWLETCGSVENLKQFRTKSDFFIEETKIFSSAQKINIICADPGMGKSMLMANLKNNYPSSFWVIKIFLREHSKFFEECSSNEQFLDYIIKKTNLQQFEARVFNIYREKRKIVFLWDGLDEIGKTAFINALVAIEGLQKLGYVQWITARSNLKRVLENKFNTFARTVKPFDVEDQRIYIKKRIKCGDLPQITEEITKNIESNNFGVPLQIFLLTELFRKDHKKCRQFLLNKFSITDLIGYFVEEQFNFFYNKSGIDLGNNVAKLIVEEHRRTRLENYEIVALNLCLDPKILETLHLNNCEPFLTTITEKNDSFGILQVTNNIPNFAHRTYAEYFVALWLSKNYRKVVNLANFFFDDNFKSVRLMFDLILAKNCPAHVAVLYKNLKAVKHHQDKLHLKDEAGRTPLHLATSWGEAHPILNTSQNGKEIILSTEKGFSVKEDSQDYKELIEFLISKSNNVKQKDALFRYDCLQYADRSFSLGSLDAIAKSQGINFNDLDNFKNLSTVLYYSIKFNYANLFRLMDQIPYVETNLNATALHWIASYNRLKFLPKMLSNESYKKAINKTDHKSWAPIHYASYHGNLEMVKELRRFGGDIGLGSKNGEETPLFVAAQNGKVAILKYLVDNKVSVNQSKKNGWTPLLVATQKLHFEAVKLLIHHQADVNKANQEGNAPLYVAARKGSLEIAKFLISQKAKVNMVNTHGEGALYIASKNGYFLVCKLLIHNGAQVNIVKKNGWTPLMIATKNGHLDIVKLLLVNNAQFCFSKSNRFVKMIGKVHHENLPTPLHIAAEKGYLDIIKCLMQYGADVNVPMGNGWTPLYSAIDSGHLGLVKFLIEHRARVDTSLVNTAAEKGYVDILKVLVKHRNIGHMSAVNQLYLLKKAQMNQRTKSQMVLMRNFKRLEAVKIEHKAVLMSRLKKWLLLAILIMLLLILIFVTSFILDMFNVK